MVCGFDEATLSGVKVGNAFGDNDALQAMDADCPQIKVGVMIAGGLESFNGTLQCATVFHPAIGTVGEGVGVRDDRHEKNLTRAL